METLEPKPFTTTILHHAADPFRLLVESVKEYAIYLLDPSGRIVSWNTGAQRVKGFTAAEALGQPFDKMFTLEDAASGKPLRILEAALLDGRYEEEGQRPRKDGSLFWAMQTVTPLHLGDQHVGFSVIIRDVSERRQADEALRLSENRFRSLITAIAKIVWTTDATGQNHVATPTWAEYTNLPEEEVQGWGWLTAIHPADRGAVAERWRHSLEAIEPIDLKFRVRRSDGEWRHFSMRGVPLLDADGGVREWIGVCEDHTEQRHAEERLRLRDQAMQAVSQGIIITDPTRNDNPVIYVSKGFEAITGYATEAVIGRNCRFLQGEDTDPATVRKMRDALLAERECSVEVLNYKQDKTPFWNALYLTPVHDDGGKLVHVVGVSVDVTERRILERALQESQKMDAIGRLAGGVAHDFNNLLTIISGYSDMLLMETLSNENRGMVVEIRQAGERAASLTRQLLAFSRKQVIQPVVLDLNDVLAQSENMLRRLIGEDISFVTILDPRAPRVLVDPGQVDQVVMNLCVNARDAMPTGGRLTIDTSEFVLEAGRLSDSDLHPGRYAQLRVTDTGCGMTGRVMAQIFEPFFTTKEPGKGTGLGLATVFGIIKQSNASISVSSEVGVGTTFKILFPASEQAALGQLADSSPSRPLGGTETILLVEDEAGVRKIAAISLQAQGYEVLEAVSGADSIEQAARHPGHIDLVVTDVVMPEMGGRELADVLRARFPGIKVLFMSGYTDDVVIRNGIISNTDNFLQKPFTPLAFAKKVRAVLDATM